jgi:DNA helicase HerA-like ATPase
MNFAKHTWIIGKLLPKLLEIKINPMNGEINRPTVTKSNMESRIFLSKTARCCIVFEEAHSLTPEWNSVVNSGDEKHSNGTSKVILQGRKFSLGCILITQRTANVTKSILNQCNTIFALRVFDDTGKTFLENYIGKDYSDTLPTLEERHAIAIGKGIGLKQPIILQLNDTKYIQSENLESN